MSARVGSRTASAGSRTASAIAGLYRLHPGATTTADSQARAERIVACERAGRDRGRLTAQQAATLRRCSSGPEQSHRLDSRRVLDVREADTARSGQSRRDERAAGDDGAGHRGVCLERCTRLTAAFVTWEAREAQWRQLCRDPWRSASLLSTRRKATGKRANLDAASARDLICPVIARTESAQRDGCDPSRTLLPLRGFCRGDVDRDRPGAPLALSDEARRCLADVDLARSPRLLVRRTRPRPG